MDDESKIHQGLRKFLKFILRLFSIELNNALFARQKLDGQFQETQMVLSVNQNLFN